MIGINLSPKQISQFQNRTYLFYRENKRELPWRNTTNPYFIMVSEYMLQQTQVNRVLEKYDLWLAAFPDLHSLAGSSLKEVLMIWQGLGYNRRAKYIHETSKIISSVYNNMFPQSYDDLIKLPGIGPYTASAICTFAFQKPRVFIETNIRTVFLHTFFKKRDKVADKEVLELIKQTLDRNNPRDWYYALMDFGAMIKMKFGNVNVKSKHYTKQRKFRGSNREVRGYILKVMSKNEYLRSNFIEKMPFTKYRIDLALKSLESDGLVIKNPVGLYSISSD